MSSDLIMGGANIRFWLLFEGRAPQGQQALRPHLIGSLQGLAQPTRNVLEPQQSCAEESRRPEIETPLVARSPLPHGQILGDALFALQPSDRLALAPEFVDEFQRKRLPAVKDPAACDDAQIGFVQLPPLRHKTFEPVEGVADDLLQGRARFRAYCMERARF